MADVKKKKKKPAGKGKDPRRDSGRDQKPKQNRGGEDTGHPKGWFSEQFLPYILGAVALFLAVCFALDFIGGAATPTEHLMGVFGYYICQFLYGCFGWMAYLLPALLAVLAIFWKKSCQERRMVSRVVITSLFMVFLSAFVHVVLCAVDGSMADVYNPVDLYTAGAKFESGGVIGGLVGNLLYLALKLPGTIVLAVLTLPLFIMYLVNVTPAYVFGKIADRYRAAKEAREDEDDEDDEEEDDRSARRSRRKQAKDHGDDRRSDDRRGDDRRSDDRRGNDHSDGEEEDRPTTGRGHRSRGNAVLVDSETGEVLDDADEGETNEETRPARGRHGRAAHAAKEDADSRADDTTEERDEDDVPATLPLRERRSARADRADDRAASAAETDGDDVPWDDSPSGRLSDRVPERATRSDRSDRQAELEAQRAAWRDAKAGDDADRAEETETMSVSLDDDADEPAYRTHRAAESAPTRPGETITVRVLKSETGAVDERGLSEEEVVLPSSTGASVETAAGETREYVFPPVDMLTRGDSHYEADEEEIAENTRILREVLESFRVGVRDISCSCGPTITRFEVKPDTGVRVRSIANLVDDIAMNLAKAGVRIEAPIPGKNAVGIEVPNSEPSTVYFRNILEAPEFRNHKSRIAACLGADVSGRPVIIDINKMPHLLIAGTTGSGKSVCINSIIMSILYKAKPDEVKLILIDPKKVEFNMYRDLPHLYAPIVSDPKKAAGALNSAVNEMERRFELIEEVGVRNLAGYNEATADDPERPYLPQMVIVIDELADLMMTAPAEVETAICRIAQKARAAGIHLIVGTQRPSVDVITGLIKANIPSRIAFTVVSAVDSRTIIDTVGADKLIGRGDMLYSPVGSTKPMRVQGTFISDGEVERVVTFLKENNEKPVYNEEFTHNIDVEAAKCGVGKRKGDMSGDDFDGLGGRQDGEDAKFWEALEVAVTKEKIGTSALQRALKIGYGRAAGVIDRMEELGFVGPDDGTKQGRKVYITKQNLMEYKMNGLPGSRGAEEEPSSDVNVTLSADDFDQL